MLLKIILMKRGKLNLLFELDYKEYIKKLEIKPEYLMQKTNTIDYLLNYLNLESN